jgi:hypothetical protein
MNFYMMSDSKTLIKISLFIFFIAVVFTNCKKNDLGGSSVVYGKVSHHSKLIPGATVFIKFGTKDFPGGDTSIYNSKVKCDAMGNFRIDNFYQGDYYLFAVGKDSGIPYPYIVKGGISVTLRDSETLARDIAVTE